MEIMDGTALQPQTRRRFHYHCRGKGRWCFAGDWLVARAGVVVVDMALWMVCLAVGGTAGGVVEGIAVGDIGIAVRVGGDFAAAGG